jgi:hypothetical protein
MVVKDLIEKLQRCDPNATVMVVNKVKDVTGYSSWTWWHTTVDTFESKVESAVDLETKVHLVPEGGTQELHKDWHDKHSEDYK